METKQGVIKDERKENEKKGRQGEGKERSKAGRKKQTEEEKWGNREEGRN